MKPEAQLSASLYELLQFLKPKCIYFAVPNGFTSKSLIHVVNMKRQGLTPGAFDWVFMWMNGCGGIELKVGKNKQSESQKEFEQWCKREGVPYRVARTIDECHDILREWKRV